MSLDYENEDEEKKEVELELTMDETVKVIESKEVEELKQELNRIIVPIEAPPMFPRHPVKCANPHDYPESYNSNTKKEELILQFVENFKSQFQYIYPDRKPLFMSPYNECGISKFVSTTLRPTTMKFSQIYDWSHCAQFVSDYLQFVPLESTTDFPQVLWSPTQILKDQRGNCFDYSMLLTSLLIGYGYDAYVVCGYATREVCNMDQSRKTCPLLTRAQEREAEARRREMGRYTVKPPRDLNSKYIVSQEQKARRKLAEAAEKRRIEHEMYLAELEKPPADPLYGQRVHCWVLVLSGKREVPESFFVEALTGTAVSTKDDNYLGIESVWNHKNYWVNMQSCYDGTAGLVYDLGDSSRWEYMLPSNDKPHLLIPNLGDQNDDDEDDSSSPDPLSLSKDLDDDDAEVVVDGADDKRKANKRAPLARTPLNKPKKMDPKEVEKHLDLPPSWVKPLLITAKEFERRYPNGIKVAYFKKCKVEKFAPYLLNDKMVMRMTEYLDNEMKTNKQTTEEFMHRADKIKKRVTDYINGWVVETFDRGRSKCLKEHKYQLIPGNERVMHFYDDARVDGLKCREETANEMVEHFTHRSDFLFYRKVVFEKRQTKKFGPQDGENFRTILKIVERYNRDESKRAYDDIHEIIYFMEPNNEKVQLTYHRESSKIAPSTREFAKPANWYDKANASIWKDELHSTYQAGTEYKQKKNVELYQMLLHLYEREERAKAAVRKSEDEVRTILDERTHEETKTEHTISIYDTERNTKAREYKLDLDKKAEEEFLRKQTPKVDYLAPFLAIRGITDARDITTEDAIYLRQMCLADLKQRLIDKANLIQKRFEAENSEMQKKQQWYQANQVNMSREDEQEYLDYCAEAMFRIHILELRLNRHKESAPIKYQKMDERLREDPRLQLAR